MNQAQTPDNEVAEVSMPSDKSMLTAQSDSVEIYHALCDRSADFSKALDACRDYRKQLDEQTNEVERLREENANLKGIISAIIENRRPLLVQEEMPLEDALKRIEWHQN